MLTAKRILVTAKKIQLNIYKNTAYNIGFVQWLLSGKFAMAQLLNLMF